jgi:hypothetical protein
MEQTKISPHDVDDAIIFINWAHLTDRVPNLLLGEPLERDHNDQAQYAILTTPRGLDSQVGRVVKLKRFVCSLSNSLVQLWETE